MKNTVNIMGRLGKDAETKTMESGKKVTHFNVATTETYKNDKGEKKEDTQWHRCTLWGHDNLLPYLKSGILVDIEGKLKYGQYDDKEGKKVYTTEIIVNEIILLPSNAKTTGATTGGEKTEATA